MNKYTAKIKLSSNYVNACKCNMDLTCIITYHNISTKYITFACKF